MLYTNAAAIPGEPLDWTLDFVVLFLVVTGRAGWYFDPNPRLWLTSLGLSLIIGFALYISTTAAGNKKVHLEFWQTFRLFLMPFCVSSFAALVKGRRFCPRVLAKPG